MPQKYKVLFVGKDTRPLVDISEHLDEQLYSVYFAHAEHPVEYIPAHARWHPTGAIVYLAGDESSDDLLRLITDYPDTSFLFLTDTNEDGGEKADLVRQSGGVLVDPMETSPQRLVEELESLIFHRKIRRGQESDRYCRTQSTARNHR
jgi:hypothetical protein